MHEQSANEFLQSKACFRKKLFIFLLAKMPPSQIHKKASIFIFALFIAFAILEKYMVPKINYFIRSIT
jgi:hypothetical protein